MNDHFKEQLQLLDIEIMAKDADIAIVDDDFSFSLLMKDYLIQSCDFEAALFEVALSLTKQVARDGEGAEKLIEVCVDKARDESQAKLVAKSIVNSPLVKTAVHGADPNWGRVAMAVGKCSNERDIDESKVVIRFGTQEVYPKSVDASGLAALSQYMRSDTVRIHVTLNIGEADCTVWGCDLTDGYVRINADYTT